MKNMILLYLSLEFIIFVVVTLEERNYFWKEFHDWPPCSVTCGEGIMIKEIFCTKKYNGTFIKIPKEKCLNVPEPKMNIKPCHNPKCTVVYTWKAYKWSSCSHICGNLGLQTRDIDCSEINGDSKDIIVGEEFCDKLSKPHTRSICNKIDCKPSFITSKWGKCIKGDKCIPGKQLQKIRCTKLLKDGTIKPISLSQCYRRIHPAPSIWRKCFDFMDSEHCRNKSSQRKVKFNSLNNILYQMRQSRAVHLNIGQIGYLLPYSRVIVACSLENFPLHEIKWNFKNHTYKYDGKVSKRIKVNKSGNLKIRRLIFEDQGEWKCIADQSYKSAIIKIRNPSSGFKDWAIRSNLWKMGMLSEESVGSKNSREVIHWVKSEWSICSVTCSGDGSQYRDVQCEKVNLRTYEILDDTECENVLKSYPAKIRICHNSVNCPKWKYNTSINSKCLNECINVGVGYRETQLKCFYLEEEVPLHVCDLEKKPYLQCKNEMCQLDWRVSPWSKCSKSCGGLGFQARHLACVWKHSRKSAGSLCHYNKLTTPLVVRKCITKTCIMGCVDLSSMCFTSKEKCYLSLNRHLCCDTCKKYFKKLTMIGK